MYVNGRGRAFRVQFETPDSPGFVRDATDAGAAEAVEAARAALTRHREALEPLFLQVSEQSRPR